jgi:hypothetical protein
VPEVGSMADEGVKVGQQTNSFIHSFYLAFIIATTVTLEQVTSLNTLFLKSFCPNA